jgi:pyruvate,water dikinase
MEKHNLPISEIGAKAAGLIRLQHAGYCVPPFYILPYSFLSTLSVDKDEAIAAISVYISQLPIENTFFAVRSSSANEDGENESFAGQFKTLLGVSNATLPHAIWKLCDHFKTKSHRDYSTQIINQYAIVIQELIEPDFAGVGFSSHPTDPSSKDPMLSIIPGGGEALVSGRKEALLLSLKNNKWHSTNEEELFPGESLIHQRPILPLTGEAIMQSIQWSLPELRKGLQRLEKLLGKPVDVEFAIANSTVYWLQVRPITTIGPPTLRIWDCTAAEINYHGITLPLTADFVQRSFHLAYRNLALRLGLLKKNNWMEAHLMRMSDSYQGVLYYNVTAWQQLIAQLPFGVKAAKQLPKLWGMDPLEFTAFSFTSKWQKLRAFFRLCYYFISNRALKKKYKQRLSTVLQQSQNSSKLSISELIARYKEDEEQLASNWLAPAVNGLYTLLFLQTLKKSLADSKLVNDHPNFANDIFQQQTSVITVQMVYDFQEIIQLIHKNVHCKHWFQTEKPMKISTDLPLQFPEVADAVANYLRNFGAKAQAAELKLETVTFEMNPISFIAYIQQNLDIPILQKAQPLDYHLHINRYYGRFHPKTWWLLFLVNQCIQRIGDRENYRFDRTKTFAHMRNLIVAMEAELIGLGKLTEKGDCFYLTIQQLFDWQNLDLKTIVSNQKEQFIHFQELSIETRYRETKNGFEVVSNATESSDLKGIGCCSGKVTGEVIQQQDITPSTDITTKIIIAAFFEPGDIGLFSKAAGLISARGNLLSHTAILCRELGIPSIVGVKGLLTQLKTGDRIAMDGGTGQLKRIEK